MIENWSELFLLTAILAVQVAICWKLWAGMSKDIHAIDTTRVAQAMASNAISSFGTDAISENDLRIYVRANYLALCSQTGISDIYLAEIQDLTCEMLATILDEMNENASVENFIYA